MFPEDNPRVSPLRLHCESHSAFLMCCRVPGEFISAVFCKHEPAIKELGQVSGRRTPGIPPKRFQRVVRAQGGEFTAEDLKSERRALLQIER